MRMNMIILLSYSLTLTVGLLYLQNYSLSVFSSLYGFHLSVSAMLQDNMLLRS